MSQLTISVITAVFNNRSTVAAALDSVLQQSYPSVEVIVVDGMSTDGTQEILADYASRLNEYVSELDAGMYDALNKGVGLATGDIVGFLHSDDLLADDHVLARIADAFADPDVDAVYGDLVYVRRQNSNQVLRYWRAGEFKYARLAWGWMPPHPTLYVRRRVYERLGGFDLTYRIAADYDCMLRFFTGGVRAVYVPNLLVRMRVGGISNRSFRNIMVKSAEDYRALRNNGIGGVGALLAKNIRKLPQFFIR
jgi:glycosyltransferase involved in cell wall biosynthesis